MPRTSNPETTTVGFFIVNVHFKIKTLWGEVVKFGGEASPLPPPVDETLPIY